MRPIGRREFLRTSGLALAALGTSNLLSGRLFADSPPPANVFSERYGISPADMRRVLDAAMSKGGGFADLFFEYTITNTVLMEEGIVKTASENIAMGVGVRVLKDDQTGFAYTNDLTLKGMTAAALTAAAISSSAKAGIAADLRVVPPGQQLYDLKRIVCEEELGNKLDLVRAAYDGAKSHDQRIVLAQAFLLDSLQQVTIANSEGLLTSDTRPQAILYAVAVASDGTNQTQCYRSSGGRAGYEHFVVEEPARETGRKAAENAITLLSAQDAVAGEQTVVLGAGHSGVMIHEAVGHPFEGDGIRKETSIFWDKLGQQVARPIVNIYDDGTIPHSRGSLNIDDEGRPTEKTMLVENGKLVGFLHDRLNAGLMSQRPTGNGRRQSYQNYPIPRMRNTFLAQGETTPEEIIRSVKKGFYAETFEGGNVMPSGKFTFSVNVGYLIEDGALTRPVRNATLIGTNVDILNEVSMIGNDMGVFLGTCGKEGQFVPVTAGTPTMKIDRMTVGGRS